MNPVKIAVIQATPVIFNLESTIEKSIELIKDAAGKKAKIDFDVTGHYMRNDIFSFQAKDQPALIKHRMK
jgi:hypothetical protein